MTPLTDWIAAAKARLDECEDNDPQMHHKYYELRDRLTRALAMLEMAHGALRKTLTTVFPEDAATKALGKLDAMAKEDAG